MYDAIIIGCGPSGMTAAIYLLRENKKVLILEKETIGGKISSAPLVQNYPGYISVSGLELSNQMYEQVLNLGGIVEIEEAKKIVPGKIHHVITDMNEYDAKCVILASGSSHRLLGISNEEDYIGNGISFCTVCDGAFYKDGVVAVAGGGNTAIINALSLASICKHVYLLVRSAQLKGDSKRVEEVLETPNVEILYDTTIESLEGSKSLENIWIRKKERQEKLQIDALFVSIGQDANTDYLNGVVSLFQDQTILVDEDCKTNVLGIFACGDVIHKKVRQLTTAVNDGTIAALSAILYLNQK